MHEQLLILTGLMRVSPRLGKPGRAGLLLSMELGADLGLRNSDQKFQRPLAGGGPVVLAEQYANEVGGAAVHLGASAGVALPLGTRQEVRLSGFYQRYLPSANVHVAGVRAAYTLFRN